MTTTHKTTDLGLWRPYTDQGKTPWRIKTLRMGEKLSMRKKPIRINSMIVDINRCIQMYSTANDMSEWKLKKRYSLQRISKGVAHMQT